MSNVASALGLCRVNELSGRTVHSGSGGPAQLEGCDRQPDELRIGDYRTSLV